MTQCPGGQVWDGSNCVCGADQYWDGSNCQSSRCGDGYCDPTESGWSCPKYPDGSGGGDCACIATSRTCNYAGVFEHYSNCGGKQVIDTCQFGCLDGKCNPDPCAGVTCNSPPASYCSGTSVVYYNSPGTCSGGSCGYLTGSYGCPTSGCSGSYRQAGGCSGGSCYLNSVENCGSDYWGCSDSETRAYRSQGCSGGNCYGSWSQPQNCNNNNYCSNSGVTYPTCTNSDTAVTRQNRVYNDYGCSGGNCYLASQYASGSCPPVDTSPVTCSNSNGWVNVGAPYSACNLGSACTAQNQEYRSYGCSSGSCTYSVTNTQTIYSGCSSCPSSGCSGDTRYYSGTCSGGSCTYGGSQDCNVNNYCGNSGSPYSVCSSSNIVVTRQDRVYNDYTCSGGNCAVASSYASGNCPPVDSNPQTCSPSAPTCSGTSRCTYSAGCSGGSCYNSPSCSQCPTPATACSGTSVRTYSPTCSGGSCSSTYSDSQCPTPTPVCVSSGTFRTYSPTCSGGSCSSTYSDSACPGGTTCSGGSCISCICSTPSPTCADSVTKRTYSPTCPGGSCSSTYSDSACPTAATDCANSVTRRTYTAYCSGGTCGNTPTSTTCPTVSTDCADPVTRRTYTAYCSGGSCGNTPTNTACPSQAPTCADTTTRRTYSPTCLAGNCGVSPVDAACSVTSPTCADSVTRRTYTAYCSGGSCGNTPTDTACPTSAATCANPTTRRTYAPTCLAGTCGNSPTDSACPTPATTCADANTRRVYSATCLAGSCGSTYTDSACQYGCSNGVCGTNPCSPNPCTNVPQNTCSGSTLNVYSSLCTPSGGSASCSYPATPQSCQYGCLSLPGPDQCAANSPPTFSSVSVSGAFQSYVRNGHTIAVSSAGTDPNGEQVKLKCGSATGNYNLCTGNPVASNPTCSFTNSWSDSNDHTIYCALEDSASANSVERTATVSADNTGPTLTLSRSPSTAQIAPGISVSLTADASDARSGISIINIVVDGYNAKLCSSGTCSYTFTPSYGSHTYYANAYDRVGNVVWARDSSGALPGSGPNGNGTAPPPGTNPGEGTTPLPLPTPVPGEVGSPCSNNNDCRSNVCSNSQCTAAPGPLPPPSPMPVNNAPTVQPMDFTPRGSCKQGSTITLQCTASDANQAANTLSTKAWSGTCTVGNCFATRSWTYLNNAGMTAPSSGGTFTRDITITAPEGTGIAATCQATDSLSATSNWGDAYPLCVVNNCPNPPTITITSITPNPSPAGTLSVTFTASRSLQGDPVVKIKPGSQQGGTSQKAGSMRQKQGNSYTFDIPVSAGDANGISDVWVDAGFTAPNGNCQFSSPIQQITIDTQPPTTTARCNGLPCSNMIYTAPLQLTFGCSDATTSCDSTLFSVDSRASDKYSGTRQLSADGPHTIYYLSNDSLGNREIEKSQPISVFKPPCINPAEEPSCNPSGFVGVELYAKLDFSKTSVITGDDAQANLYCFLRTKDLTKRFIRPCNPDPTKLSIIVDKGTANQKDYFNPANGYIPPSRADFVKPTYQKDGNYNLPTIDGTYAITRRWDFKLNTNIFRSSVCINVTDLGSGLSVEACGDYTVTETEFLFGAYFPDLGVTVPLTIDPGHDQVANFTKTMLINFTAVPSTRTFSGVSVCEPPNCRVDFSFDAPTYDKTTKWDAFRKVFVASNVIDIASNNFACDQYKTIYLQAQQAGGPPATTSKEFFVNCQTKITVTPVEKRFALGDQPADNVFSVTVYNPKEGAANKIFDVTSSTTSPIFSFQWIEFKCTEGGCIVDPDNNDKVQLDMPPESQKSFSVSVSTVARTGSFPITFVATDPDGNTYSTLATILVFAEGLDEFAAWQLIILVIIAIAFIAYYKIDLGHRKKRKTSKRK
ncbi:MAG: Ig-like domain-containing protein [Candidatus Aenigmatarchaeota archaeon]